MRTVALGLVLLTGCNQLLGLDSVVVSDGGIDAPPYDAPWPVVSLLAITPELDDFAQPTGHAITVPLLAGGAVKVQYGPQGGDLTSLETGTYGANGDVEIPPRLVSGGPWRFVYTFANGTIHETQFSGETTSRRIVDLQMTPFDRPEVPSGMNFVMTPTNAPGTYTSPRVYVTNAWSELAFATTAGPTVKVPLESMTAIAGLKRAPGPLDDVILAMYQQIQTSNGASCSYVSGATKFHFVVAFGDVTAAMPPSWVSSDHPATTLMTSNRIGPVFNLAAASELTGNPQLQVSYSSYLTLTPTGELPQLRGNAVFPFPVGATMVSCVGDPPLPLPTFRSVSAQQLSAAEAATYGYTLGTGLFVANAIITVATKELESTQFSLQYTVKLPYKFTIAGVAVPTNVPAIVPISFGTANKADLAWTFQNEAEVVPVDAFEVTLFQITATTMTPVREYSFVEGPLSFDTQLIEPNTTYAFRVRAIIGVPNAKTGKFDTWNVKQQASQVWTQAFSRQ